MFSMILAAVAAAALQTTAPTLAIETVHDSVDEVETAQQLALLLETYALDNRIWTRQVQIDRSAIPHSHPVLTLHTRYIEDDTGLLATFLHEQLHWFVMTRPEERDAAMADLAALYPDIPIGYPDGARDAHSNALHLVVCLLELRALSEQVGEAAARHSLGGNTHYREIYRIILEDTATVQAVLDRHGLALPPLSSRQR